MDEWLHCNYCSVRFSQNCTSFVVTTCTHTFCSKCEERASKPVCVVCQQKCSVAKLNEKIQAGVAEYFKPPSELRKKAMDLFKRADEVTKFQNNQMKMLRRREQARSEEQSKTMKGAMQTIEHLQKENIEMKKMVFRHRNNTCVSPNGSRHPASRSPDASPHRSPSASPRRSSGRVLSSPHQHSNTVPCSPNKPLMDNFQLNLNKPYKSPNEGVRRVSMRSPPVDGRLCMQSPPNVSPNRGHPYKASEGIVSKQAVKPSPSSAGSGMHRFASYQSPKPFGTTPPSTPKYSFSRGYNSCPVTPDSKISSVYAPRQDSRR